MKFFYMVISLCLTIPLFGVEKIVWRDVARDADFAVEGCFKTPGTPAFQRLPENGEFSKLNRIHGRNSAGIQVRFRSDSKKVRVRVKLESSGTMCHIPATGQSGIDLYIGTPGQERYVDTTIFDPAKPGYEVELLDAQKAKMRDFTLNLPLFNTVLALEIGLIPGAVVRPPIKRPAGKIVFYGTSITQGGCASRPGMCHTNILSRRLGREILNFGFSGSGTLDLPVAVLLAKIPDPVLYVIECEANCSNEVLCVRLRPFVAALRTAHPSVPILLVSALPSKNTNDVADRFQRDFVRQSNDRNLHFLDGRSLLGDNPGECTVDNLHLTTLGFQRYAEALEKTIKGLL